MGGARTALFNWLYARHHAGTMLLRIEDTDAALRSDAYVNAIIEPLRWLGLDWDAPPWFQSDNRETHLEAVEELLAQGAAYRCDLTPEDIARRAAEEGKPPGYHGWSRERNVSDGPGVVVRFRVPDSGVTVVNDIIRKSVTFPNDSLEDFVIRRGDGTPTFHIANAVDDHQMGITHVIRGEDLLNTTPRVLLLWQALGYGPPPVYAHLPLLVDAKRRKLSKRRDDVSLGDYRESGYLPEAMVNYLALLGWGPTDNVEIRPLSELVELFDLDAVNPAPAFFDRAKLDHFNQSYLRALSPQQFATQAEPFVAARLNSSTDDSEDGDGRSDATGDASSRMAEVLEALAEDIAPRVNTLSEVAGWIDWILADTVAYQERAWNKALVKGRAAREVLEIVLSRLSEDDFTNPERLEEIVMGVGAELGESLGARVMSQAPVRVAVTGSNVGLPLWPALVLLGKQRTLERLQHCLERLDPPA